MMILVYILRSFQYCRTAKGNPPVTFAIAACETQNVNVSVLPSFGLSEESSMTAKHMWSKMVKVLTAPVFLGFLNNIFGGKYTGLVLIEMVTCFFKDGQFDQENFNSGPSMPSSPGETLCAAVAASMWVEPHGKCTVAFSLAWSSPKVKFVKGSTFNR